MALGDPRILDLTLTAAERWAVDRFVERVRARFGARVESLVLYGSKARGDAGEESDIDVAVVFAGEPADAERSEIAAVAVQVQLEAAAPMLLSPLVVSRARLEALRALERRFPRDLEEEGIPL